MEDLMLELTGDRLTAVKAGSVCKLHGYTPSGKCPECDAAADIADLNAALEASESEARALRCEVERLRAAITGLLRFHQEGDDGDHLPREYWTPGYREAVEIAEELVWSNNQVQAGEAWNDGFGIFRPRERELSMTDYEKAVRRGWIGGVLFMAGVVMATQDWYGLEGYIARLRGGDWIVLPWWVGGLIATGAAWWAHKTPNK